MRIYYKNKNKKKMRRFVQSKVYYNKKSIVMSAKYCEVSLGGCIV